MRNRRESAHPPAGVDARSAGEVDQWLPGVRDGSEREEAVWP